MEFNAIDKMNQTVKNRLNLLVDLINEKKVEALILIFCIELYYI